MALIAAQEICNLHILFLSVVITASHKKEQPIQKGLYNTTTIPLLKQLHMLKHHNIVSLWSKWQYFWLALACFHRLTVYFCKDGAWKAANTVTNCKIYFVFFGLFVFLATLISICVRSLNWCFLIYFFGIKKAIHVALVKPVPKKSLLI